MTAPAARPASGGGAGELVPSWLVNTAALAWRLVAIVLMIGAVWLITSTIKTVTAAVAIAVVVTAVLVPAIRALRARGRSRSAAAGIVWATAMGVVALVTIVLAAMFLPEIVPVLKALQIAVADLQARLAGLSVPPIVGDIVGGIIGLGLSVVRAFAADVAGSVASAVTSLVIATFLVFFLLADGDRAWAWSLQAMPEDKRDHLTTAGEAALGRVAGYLVGTTVLSAITAGTDLVFMWVLGVPLAVPLAVLVFLAGYIPYFGGIVTTLVVLVVTLSAVGPTACVAMLVLIAARNGVVGYAIRPSVYGRSVKLHPALVLIALPAGYELAGVIGLFAAVPLTAVVLAVASAVVEAVEPDQAPALPGLVPAWLDRIAQWSWRLLAVLALIALLVLFVVSIPMVFVPVVLGVILAATFAPVTRWLTGRGWSRNRAIGVTLAGSILTIGALLVLALGEIIAQAEPLATGAVEGADAANQATGGTLGLAVQAVQVVSSSGLATLRTVTTEVGSALVVILLSTLLCFYFMRDGDRLWSRLVRRVPDRHEADVRSAGRRAFEVLGGYMYGTAAISFVGAASQFVIMVLLGVPYALPVFVLSFFLCFIPYIGGFISTGLALLLTIGTGSDSAIIVMAVWTLVFNIVTGNIVSPIVYGKTVSLHPAIVLIAIPIGSTVAGILGMLLVVPVLGVIAVSWRTVIRLMASDPGAAGGDSPSDAGVPGTAPPVEPVPAVAG